MRHLATRQNQSNSVDDMDWNNERTTTFIQDYRNSPALWNNKIGEYKDNRIKNDKLKELADKYNCTVTEIKNKIKNLRSAYHRERKKVQSKKKTAKWFAFELLSFLPDVVDLPISTFSTAGGDDEDFEGGEQEDNRNIRYAQVKEESENLYEVSNKRRRRNRSEEEGEKGIAPIKKTRMDLSHSDREEEAYGIVKTACQRDDCSTYGEHVANELRKLGPRAQTIAKHMINNTLFEAAMGKYDDEST